MSFTVKIFTAGGGRYGATTAAPTFAAAIIQAKRATTDPSNPHGHIALVNESQGKAHATVVKGAVAHRVDPEPTCPGCSGDLVDGSNLPEGVQVCGHCGGLVTVDRIPRNTAERLVGFSKSMEAGDSAETRYFDLDLIGGARVHGWFNPETRRVVQYG